MPSARFLLLCGLACLLPAGCSRQPAGPPAPSRVEIWNAIQPQAARYELSPGFVYALVAAESNFNPRARNGEARGLMQIKPAAWKEVSSAPYEPTVWEWRANLEAGIDYIAFSRAYLHRKQVFSYPLLLAAFHYGLAHVEERNFDLRRIPVPPNGIYRRLWSGNLEPLPPPGGGVASGKR